MPAPLSAGRPADPPGHLAPGIPQQPARSAMLALPATPVDAHTVRHWSAHALTHWGVNGTCLDDALLVIAEFTANAVEHGGDGMSVALTLSDTSLTVAVSDNGPNDPRDIPYPCTPLGLHEDHGRGLVLVDALTLTWRVSARHGGGVTLSAELPVRR